MTDFTVTTKVQTPVKWLQADMGVRYWEDAKVNGVDEDDDNPAMPFAGDGWKIKVELATGKIYDWPKGVIAETHYKVCDAGVYALLSDTGEKVCERDWYVPSMLCPGGDGYGDYVIMKIDGDGRIENWSVDLSFFEDDDE